MRTRAIAVVGAGPTGCLLATLLARAGHGVTLFERRRRPGPGGASGGRSINLVLPRSTLDALVELGAGADLIEASVELRGRVAHDRNGAVSRGPYRFAPDAGSESPLQPSEVPASVRRDTLLAALLGMAEREPNVAVKSGHTLVAADVDSGRLQFRTSSGAVVGVEADLVIGADGLRSSLRGFMAGRPRFRCELRESEIRYREVRVAADASRRSFDPGCVHLWPRPELLLVGLPNADGSFTFTLFAAERAREDIEALDDPARRRRFLEREFPDFAATGAWRPPTHGGAADGTYRLASVRCRPWHTGVAALAGDACHAMLPFSGRGTSEGLADAMELARRFEQADGDEVASVFAAYDRSRRPATDAIASYASALAPLLLTMLPPSGVASDL